MFDFFFTPLVTVTLSSIISQKPAIYTKIIGILFTVSLQGLQKFPKKPDHVTVVTFSPSVLPKRPTRGSPSYIYRPTYITGNLNILVRFSIFRNLLRIKALNLGVREVYLFSIACAHSNQGLHEIYKV